MQSVASKQLQEVAEMGALPLLGLMLFACRVVEGRTEFSAVPAKLKQQVANININDFELPEIVPTEYGGTAAAE